MIREQRLANTFVELVDNLVEDFDVVELMTLLTERSVELLDADAAGLLLRGESGRLHVVAATSKATEVVELFQTQNEEGPCHDCCSTGTPLNVADLAGEEGRWPRFAPVAVAAGFRAAHAFPLRLRGEVLGAMNLFRAEPVELAGPDLAVAQALADVATITLVQSRALVDAQIVQQQLQHALNSRIVIEQAKGVLAERRGCEMDEAFDLLRAFAREEGRRMGEVAADVVAGRRVIPNP